MFTHNKSLVTILIISRSPVSVSLSFVSAAAFQRSAPPLAPIFDRLACSGGVLGWEVVETLEGGASVEEACWIVWPHFLCALFFLTSDAV